MADGRAYIDFIFGKKEGVARRSSKFYFACLCFSSSAETIRNPFYTLFTLTQEGNFLDTSTNSRFLRYSAAIELVKSHPFGVGWGRSGWVHSDFLQIAANLGILAGGLFFIWYISTLGITWKQLAKRPSDHLLFGLLISFCLVGTILVFEGVHVLTQYVMPVWFIWALVELRLTQIRQKKVSTMMKS